MIKFVLRSIIMLCALITHLIVAQSEKVLIITYSYNRPDFIEWQYKTFEKFLLDDYEFVVFNDARDVEIKNEIEAICSQYNIACIRVPQNHQGNSPGARHQYAINYSLTTIGFSYEGIVCIFDGDMFLVKKFSIIDFMKNVDIAALPQCRANNVFYLFPGLVFMNMCTLPNKKTMNWSGGYVNGSAVDTGGQMHHYLINNPNIRLHKMNQLYFAGNASASENTELICDECKKTSNLACKHNTEILKKFGLDQYAISFLQEGPKGGNEFLLDGHFYHYRCSSWDFSINHEQKTFLVRQYINNLLNS